MILIVCLFVFVSAVLQFCRFSGVGVLHLVFRGREGAALASMVGQPGDDEIVIVIGGLV